MIEFLRKKNKTNPQTTPGMGKQLEKGIFSNGLTLEVISLPKNLHYHENFKILFLHSYFFSFNAAELRTLPNIGKLSG